VGVEPVNFTADFQTPGQVKLAWAAGSSTTNQIGWLVEQKIGTWSKLPQLPVATTTLTIDHPVTVPTLAQFRVWAVVKQNSRSAEGTIQPSASPPPEPVPPGPEILGMRVGLDTGGWYLTNDSAIMGGKKLLLRSQNLPTSQIAAYETHGFPVIDLIGHNPATSTDPEALATEALTRAKAHPGIEATEILNEPQNPYLGGSESQANIEAYARVVNAVAAKVVAANLTVTPHLLWSADGGFKGIPSWGAKVWPLLSKQAKEHPKVTWTCHPYGGTGERAKSALGGRGRVEEAFHLTGRRGWVTEIGWPTDTGAAPTGDSLQWTEAEQAHNIESFIRWAPPFCEAVIYFQVRDYDPNNWYGVERKDGSHKPSFAVIQALA